MAVSFQCMTKSTTIKKIIIIKKLKKKKNRMALGLQSVQMNPLFGDFKGDPFSTSPPPVWRR